MQLAGHEHAYTAAVHLLLVVYYLKLVAIGWYRLGIDHQLLTARTVLLLTTCSGRRCT